MNILNFEVGQTVAVIPSGHGFSYPRLWSLKTITAATSSSVTLDDGSKWTQRGRRWGSGNGFGGAQICKKTAAEVADHNKAVFAERERETSFGHCQRINWREVSHEVRLQILALVEAAKKPS